MLNVILFLIVGAVCAAFVPPGQLVDRSGLIHGDVAASMVLWFFVGGFLSTVVRFVGPKREVIITLLGTVPIQVLKTGIRITLPLPFGWPHSTVHTDVRSSAKLKVQIKSKDDQVFWLPFTILHRVADSMKYAIERADPDKQMETMAIAAVRAAGNGMNLLEVYADKEQVKKEADKSIGDALKSFGMVITELVVEDPELPESTARALNSIREAEFDRQAAISEAKATYERMVGKARAEAESTRIKGGALSGFRMQIAEGNAAAMAVMQGKLVVEWTETTVGEGADAKQMRVAKFVKPEEAKEQHGEIPQVEIDPRTILDFFKVVDTNDTIRDAAENEGTVIIVPASGLGGADIASIAALSKGLNGHGNEHKMAA